MLPRVTHAPSFRFRSTYTLGKLSNFNRNNFHEESAQLREIIFGIVLDQGERADLIMDLRTILRSYEHVVNKNGGMNKTYFSGGDGHYGPGLLDLLLFSTLFLLRPTLNRLYKNEPDVLAGLFALSDWYDRVLKRDSVGSIATSVATNIATSFLYWIDCQFKSVAI